MSVSMLPLVALKDDPGACIQVLAASLREGSLALSLGAGMSAGVGLPPWWELVARCQSLAGEPVTVTKATPNEDIRHATDRIRAVAGNIDRFKDLVTEALYENVSYDYTIVGRPLLTALGAMMMGSTRGSVKNVITLNFDDVLEWYLSLHGFTTNIISTIPYLSRGQDVTIFHPHGYLPKMPAKNRSDHLIFDALSYDERFADILNPWSHIERDLLATHIVLFVGLSGDDPTLGSLLVNAAKVNAPMRRATGFWLLGPGGKPDDWFMDRNVVPLRFRDFNEYPEFLLRICQSAATA